MANPREKFISLSQANTSRVRTLVELPFNLSDQVGMNTAFAEALLQISGFRQVRVTGDRNGETSQTMPQIVGMDARGSALAGKAQVKSVPMQNYEIDEIFGKPKKQGRWNDLDLKLNLAEMQNQIREKDSSIRDPQAWAKEIDMALRQGLISAGVNNLLGGMDGFDKFLSVFLYTNDVAIAGGVGLGSLLSGTFEPHAPTVNGILESFLATGIIWFIVDSLMYGVERPALGRRVSLILGPELDRALVLGIVANLHNLAGVVKSK